MRTFMLAGIFAGLTLAACDSATDPGPPPQQALSSSGTPSLEFRDLQYPASITRGADHVTAYSISPSGLRISGTTVKFDEQGILAHWFTLRLSGPFGQAIASEEGSERFASGRAINDRGDLAGFRPNGDGVDRPFIHLAGTPGTTELKLAGSDRKATAWALGINNLRTVVGSYRPLGKEVDYGFQATAADHGAPVIPISSGLRHPPVVGEVSVNGINTRGDYVGDVFNGAGAHGFVVLHSPQGDRWIDVGAARPGFFPDPSAVFLGGINNSRMFVGWSGNSGFFGWVNDDGTIRNLTQVDRVPVPPGQPAPLDTRLNGVSEAGVMVGTYAGNSFLARQSSAPSK